MHTLVLVRPILDVTSKQVAMIFIRLLIDQLIDTLSHIMSESM